MSVHELIVLGVVVGAIILFITEWLSVDLIALLAIAVLVISGVLTPQQGLAGFSDPATLTVAFMLVLSAAVFQSGVLRVLSPMLGEQMRRGEVWGMLMVLLGVPVISAFLNNTPIVAIFIPIVVQAARQAGISASRMLIPLSYITILGGTSTLVGTSTNFVVSGIAVEHGLKPLALFQQTPMGLVFLAAGILYILLFGRRFLRRDRDPTGLEERFGVKDYVSEIELLPTAPSVGRRIMDSPLVKAMDMDIIEIRRDGQVFTIPAGDMVLQAHDLLKVRCDIGHIRTLGQRSHVRIRPAGGKAAEQAHADDGTKLVELVITANSPLEGSTIDEADLMRTYRAVPLAVRSREAVVNQRLEDIVLRAGDVILAEVRSHYVDRLRALDREADSPFAIIAEQEGHIGIDKRTALITTGTLLAVVLSSAFGLLPIVVAALIGVCVVVLTRCMSMKDVYDAIDWKIIFLMAGSLSLGMGMSQSGLADRSAHALVGALGDKGPIFVLAGIYIATALLTEVMSNNATAAMLAPIAIAAAQALNVSPLPFIMAVTFAASFSFMTPIGYQTNMMVYSAGRYKFTDFTRTGAPLALILFILAVALIPVFYPF
ncbi:MAG TPA: SLC13 family permease [Flavobacteriales bacterium]|nr:SLC13 family permease [Flavobacteriales bacterium]HRP82167.1 SLC13 family permease [Flavobacteriales bacterium]HRQ85405.1 SLC13 family permease [Flavobacteriales bacterium]